VAVGFEQASVHGAPHFVDAVAEDEATVFNGNGRRRPSYVLAVEVCEHRHQTGLEGGNAVERKVTSAAGLAAPAQLPRGGRRRGSLTLLNSLDPLPRKMRSNAEHALNEHQLTAVMHFVLLDAEQAFKPRSRMLSSWIGERLSQELRRQ
jgi:hypothetical protein